MPILQPKSPATRWEQKWARQAKKAEERLKKSLEKEEQKQKLTARKIAQLTDKQISDYTVGFWNLALDQHVPNMEKMLETLPEGLVVKIIDSYYAMGKAIRNFRSAHSVRETNNV